MAFYPLLDEQGTPIMFKDEGIAIRKEKVLGTLIFDNSLKVKFLGTLYLTNVRLILVNSDTNFIKFNFALHLNLICEETFDRTFGYHSIKGRFEKFLDLMPCNGKFIFEMIELNPELIQYLTELREKIKFSPQRIIQAFVNPNNPDEIIIQDRGNEIVK
jgi:hypothetical protein